MLLFEWYRINIKKKANQSSSELLYHRHIHRFYTRSEFENKTKCGRSEVEEKKKAAHKHRNACKCSDKRKWENSANKQHSMWMRTIRWRWIMNECFSYDFERIQSKCKIRHANRIGTTMTTTRTTSTTTRKQARQITLCIYVSRHDCRHNYVYLFHISGLLGLNALCRCVWVCVLEWKLYETLRLKIR